MIRVLVAAVLLLALVPLAFVNAANLVLLHATMRGPAAVPKLPPRAPSALPAAAVHDALALLARAPLANAAAVARASGRARIAAGDLAGGASLLESANDRGAAALLAGNARAASGDARAAIRDWESAAVVPLMWLQLGEDLTASEAHRRQGIAVLEDGIRAAGPRNPLTPSMTLALANAHDMLDEDAAALRLVRERLAIDRSDVAAADLELIILLRMHDDANAIAAADRVLAVRPSWAAYLARGTTRLRRCDVAGAVADFQSGLALPRPADYRYSWLSSRLGDALWESGNTQAAIAAYRRYAAEQPGPDAAAIVAQAESGRRPRLCAGAGH